MLSQSETDSNSAILLAGSPARWDAALAEHMITTSVREPQRKHACLLLSLYTDPLHGCSGWRFPYGLTAPRCRLSLAPLITGRGSDAKYILDPVNCLNKCLQWLFCSFPQLPQYLFTFPGSRWRIYGSRTLSQQVLLCGGCNFLSFLQHPNELKPPVPPDR